MRRLAVVVLLSTAAACAPKTIPAPVVMAPKFPDFVAPVVPATFADGPAAAGQERGWRFLQAGDFRSAVHEFETALRTTPAFYPAESGLGYVELAKQDLKAALPHFDRALEAEPRDLSALLGRGRALLGLNRDAEALVAFEAALRVDPSMEELARRVELLRFRGQQQDLQRARAAAQDGRFADAVAGYTRAIAASPESAFLYRELAAVEQKTGAPDRALEHLRKSLVLEPGDARVLIQVGDLLQTRGDLEGAGQAYREAIQLEPNAEVQAKLDRLTVRAEPVPPPDEYRAIEGAAQITRGELAALIEGHLAALLQQGRTRNAVLITDIRGYWAASAIVAVAQAGVMDPLANHSFLPRAVVRRVDLAQVVSRLLTRVAEATPGQPHPWQNARLKFSDLEAGHVAHPAASIAVSSGVLATAANNAFQPGRVISGQEAIEVINKIAAMMPAETSRAKSGQ